MRKATQKVRRLGFTLVELLVAVVLVGIVMIATFQFMSSMSNVFFVQDQIVDTQSNMRFALEFVLKDVKRAGYLATPSAQQDPLVCPKPRAFTQDVFAFSYIDDDTSNSVHVFGESAPQNNTNIEPDTMTIIGSFEAPDLFQLSAVDNNSATLDAAGFVRALGLDSLNNAERETAFDNLFLAGRIVRISDTDGSAQFGTITSADFNGGTPTVNFSGILRREGGRGCGIEGLSGQSYDLALLNIIQYRIEQDPGDITKSNLMRNELNSNGAPLLIAGRPASVAILEYVVDMQIMAFGDRRNTANRNPIMAADEAGDDSGSLEAGLLAPGTMWQRVRGVQINLAARTAREDPNLNHIPRSVASGRRGGKVYGPLTSFNLDADPTTSAHVLRLGGFTEIPNNTLANVR